MSAQQIRFVEMNVDHLTASGRMEPELLYAPPFTDTFPKGISDLFDVTEVAGIVDTLKEFWPRMVG